MKISTGLNFKHVLGQTQSAHNKKRQPKKGHQQEFPKQNLLTHGRGTVLWQQKLCGIFQKKVLALKL